MSVFVFWLLFYWIANEVGTNEILLNLDGVKENSAKGGSVISRATQLGFRASEHVVRTEDGYVLRLFRVHGSRRTTGPPVLLMHGLLLSAGGWLDAGNASLASLLAAAGRDVWLGNARGSHYSRSHAWLNPDTDALYWQFSADEMGRYDLPALLDYILTTTGTNKLDYIGFSQGGGTLFLMCSELPDYCAKVNLMVALAPATRMLHTKSIMFRFLCDYNEINEKELYERGIWEAFSVGGLFQSFSEYFCGLSDGVTEICEAFIDVLDGSNPGSKTKVAVRAATLNTPAGTSVHNLAWYGQQLDSHHVHKFDYGPEDNIIRYGSEKAPEYNLSAVTVPTVVIFGKNDGIVDVRDIKWLIRKLPNVRKVVEVSDPRWTHLDFVFSKNIPTLLFPKIEEMFG